MSLNGLPDQEGVRTGPAVMDISTGMMGAVAVLGALAARERTARVSKWRSRSTIPPRSCSAFTP